MNLIPLRGDIGWPARSPDLTPCDFFLWGYLKAKVYARRPGTIEQLEAIRQEVAAIPPAMTCKAMDNFRERLQQCVINNDRRLSDVIFKCLKNCIVFFISKWIFCVPCLVWFLLPFKCGSYFCHPTVVLRNMRSRFCKADAHSTGGCWKSRSPSVIFMIILYIWTWSKRCL